MTPVGDQTFSPTIKDGDNWFFTDSTVNTESALSGTDPNLVIDGRVVDGDILWSPEDSVVHTVITDIDDHRDGRRIIIFNTGQGMLSFAGEAMASVSDLEVPGPGGSIELMWDDDAERWLFIGGLID